jgi:hypothetical protein
VAEEKAEGVGLWYEERGKARVWSGWATSQSRRGWATASGASAAHVARPDTRETGEMGHRRVGPMWRHAADEQVWWAWAAGSGPGPGVR